MSKEDSHTRSAIKAISYRVLGTLATFTIAWLVTGSTDISANLAILDFFGKIVLFWLHERIWVRIK